MMTRVRYIVQALFLSFLLVASVAAQTGKRVIRAGDALQISVVNHDEFTKVVVVSQEGHIHYPFLSDVNLIGWRTSALEDRITRLLASVLTTAPYVIVSDAQYYGIRISILGQINKPGFIEVPHGIDLQGALWMAGGPTENADLTSVQIQRVGASGPTQLSINVEKFLYEGRVADLVRMQEGDLVIVKGAPDAEKVKVFGEVQSSGSFVRPYGATVLDMIYLAGGATMDGTLSDVRWLRRIGDRVVEEKLDISSLLRAGRTDEIPLVGRGDVIIVQKRILTVQAVTLVLGLLLQFLTVQALVRNL
jgi:polysaccharide biosynthesis/export protein